MILALDMNAKHQALVYGDDFNLISDDIRTIETEMAINKSKNGKQQDS